MPGAFGRCREQELRWGGNPFDNRDTIYIGTGDDVAVNDGVKRYRADDRARVLGVPQLPKLATTVD